MKPDRETLKIKMQIKSLESQIEWEKSWAKKIFTSVSSVIIISLLLLLFVKDVEILQSVIIAIVVTLLNLALSKIGLIFYERRNK